MRPALLLLLAAASARADGDAPFRAPPGWKVERAPDVSTELAFRLSPPPDARVQTASVLLGVKKLGEAELEAASAEWHDAHVRNRAAWGMHVAGGPPRDTIQVGGRRALRYRDRVGGALGSTEQTFTCAIIAARLACVLSSAPPDAHDAADTLAASLLSSLKLKSGR